MKSPHFIFRYAGITFLSALLSAGITLASPVPGNLGSGLDVLVRERLAQQQGKNSRIDQKLVEQAQSYRDAAFINPQGQVKVYVHLVPAPQNGLSHPEAVLPRRATLTAKDMSYHGGVLEAWVNVDDVSALARDKRVVSVILAIKPVLDVGAATTQGVVQHRVDQISQDGTGITVGAMSDSFNMVGGAATDVTTGDLPGPGNPVGNATPVAVLDDSTGTTDEGRAMLQIIHDLAPKAKLGFATASAGQVSFADNIRSLAGLPSGSHTQPGFAANVIVDDLFYSDSPMFGTSLVGRAVNEVAGLGVSYFSSAGNRPGIQAYFSTFKFVDSSNLSAALAGTNIPTSSFATINPALYAGGFHNFRTDGGQDVAQNVFQGIGGQGSNMTFQWDDPFDVEPPTFNPTPFFTSSGTLPPTPADFVIPLTAGVQYRIAVTDPGDTFDAVVTVLDPSSNQVLQQDTGFNEILFFFAPVSGNYTIRVTGFSGATGNFNIEANVASGTPRLTTDFNLLFFTSTGTFIKAISSNNLASNQPMEFGALTFTGGTTIQLVIARGNTPTAPIPATKIRYVNTGFAGPSEYFDYQTPVTYGHNHEAGAIGVAAYSPFRPYIPEEFTSPGPSYIYFDQNANRLANPIIRQKPDVAAQDGGNNTFFSSDAAGDTDTQPNFYGTSAAAPHAAGIAALVLQAHGGPGTVTQPQMRTILQQSGFMHDLDPFYSSASTRTSTGKLTITARANAGNFNLSDGRTISTSDTGAFGVSYVGSGSVASLSLNLANANTTGGSVLGAVPGLVWDTRAPSTAATSGFSFAIGSNPGGVTVGSVYSLAAPAPGVAGQFLQLDLTFVGLTAGQAFTFGADRDEQRTQNATTPSTGFGNSADLLGATVDIPSGNVVPGGAAISGTMGDASVFNGIFTNKIGKGYSPLDGFGFINAQDAVGLPLP